MYGNEIARGSRGKTAEAGRENALGLEKLPLDGTGGNSERRGFFSSSSSFCNGRWLFLPWPHFLCFDERDDLLVFRALARVPREEVQVNSVIVDEEFINEEMCNVYWNWLIEKCSEESFDANMMKLSSSVMKLKSNEEEGIIEGWSTYQLKEIEACQ